MWEISEGHTTHYIAKDHEEEQESLLSGSELTDADSVQPRLRRRRETHEDGVDVAGSKESGGMRRVRGHEEAGEAMTGFGQPLYLLI